MAGTEKRKEWECYLGASWIDQRGQQGLEEVAVPRETSKEQSEQPIGKPSCPAGTLWACNTQDNKGGGHDVLPISTLHRLIKEV